MNEEETLISWKDKQVLVTADLLCMVGVFQKKLYVNRAIQPAVEFRHWLNEICIYIYNRKVQEG